MTHATPTLTLCTTRANSDGARLYHAVPDGHRVSLCGYKPRGAMEWDEWPGASVTCPSCAVKLEGRTRAATQWRVWVGDSHNARACGDPMLGTVIARDRDAALALARREYGWDVEVLPHDVTIEKQIARIAKWEAEKKRKPRTGSRARKRDSAG